MITPRFPKYDSISQATVSELQEYEARFRSYVHDNDMYISLSGNSDHDLQPFVSPTQPANGAVPLVVLINGVGRSGKDTFINMVYKYMPKEILSYSAIDSVRSAVHDLCMPTDALISLNADQSDLWVSNHTHFVSYNALSNMLYNVSVSNGDTKETAIDKWVKINDNDLYKHTSGYLSISFPTGYIIIPRISKRLSDPSLDNDESTNLETLSTTQFQYDESNKTDAYRQFLYDVKEAWQKYNNGPVNDVIGRYMCWVREKFIAKDNATKPSIYFINSREVETSNRFIEEFNKLGVPVVKLLVTGHNKSSNDYMNDCDSNVDNIPESYFDIIIRNTSTLEALDITAHYFTILVKQFQLLHGIPLIWNPSK